MTLRRVRILSDGEITRRYGRRTYLPFSPGTMFYEMERAANDLCEIRAIMLVRYAHLLRRLPFIA